MAMEERWTAIRAKNNFDELLEKVITTRKPIFIDGERRSAVLISIEEWSAIQDKLSPAFCQTSDRSLARSLTV